MSIANLLLQNVQPKAGTATQGEAPHTPASGEPGMGGGLGGGIFSMLPLLLIPVMLFMMFRRQKKESDAREKLKKGDRVLTNGGLIGELVELDKQVAKVRIAPGTTVQVLASTISPFAGETEKAAS